MSEVITMSGNVRIRARFASLDYSLATILMKDGQLRVVDARNNIIAISNDYSVVIISDVFWVYLGQQR